MDAKTIELPPHDYDDLLKWHKSALKRIAELERDLADVSTALRHATGNEARLLKEAQEARAILTFDAFQKMSIARCKEAFPMCDDWSLNDWAVALAGEVGELCNLLKKNRRGMATDEQFDLSGGFHEFARGNVLRELADVIIYADLMMSILSANTGEEVAGKFDEVSRRIGYTPSPSVPTKEAQ